MRLRTSLLPAVALLLAAAIARGADGPPRSFSLSTSRTFAPGESVKIELFARNVPEFEFRVYRVSDPQKFFSGLKDLHSFGTVTSSPKEQIEESSWIERIHDFKAHLWYRIRHFFRSQFTDEARDSFRERQGKMGKRSQVVGQAQFARIPLLNGSQLVARWKLVTPPALVSETQQLPIDNLSAGVYLIEATDGTYKAYTVAIVTGIALVERTLDGQASLYVADRKSGAPIEKADLALWADGKQQSAAQSGSDGMATLSISAFSALPGRQLERIWIIARHGPDTAIVTPWGYSFQSNERNDLTAFVYTDRPVYRPGHTVHIKGVIRRKVADALNLPTADSLQLKVTDAAGATVLSQNAQISSRGTVTADLNLASDAALGFYTIELLRPGQGQNTAYVGNGNFYVEEYKKPEYQVTVKPAAPRILQGNTVQAVIEAKYFFGEPAAGAKVKYVVHTTTHYWWDEDESDDSSDESGSEVESDFDSAWGETEQQEHEGTLDANGRLTVSLPVPLDPKNNDEDFRIEARVTDAANREVAGHATILATYGSFRVSVTPASYVVQPGRPVTVKITAQDYDNKPVHTPVHVAATLTRWDSVTHQHNETQLAAQDTTTGPDGNVSVTLPVNANGSIEIRASAVTPEKRTVSGRASVWMWSGGGEWYRPNARARIVADKKSYNVGDVAHLLLITGFSESWAVVTVEGDTVQSRRLLHATGQSTAFDLPITVQCQPNVVINAFLVHENQLTTATASLKVPLVERTLTVTATPSKQKYLPGEKGSFDVYTADSQGKPVEADLSFGVVDEALYTVRPDTTENIVNFFYPRRYAYLNTQTSFDFYFFGEAGLKSPLLARLESAQFHPRLAQVKPGSDLVVPKIRKAFPDTAYWNPNVRTGPDGHARVEYDFPDALTTWRTTIRAMTVDGKAGGAVSRVLVRKNLIVRLAVPRFFRQGDETTLRVIAHNYLDTAKDVSFALDMQGLDPVNGPAPNSARVLNVPARGEAFVDWRVRPHGIGNAVLTAKALTNEESDALEVTLPILPYGVKKRAAGSGVVFSGAGQSQWPYTFPASSDPAARGLSVTVAPSIAGTVFDALGYLASYPWGCTEQTMSSFLPDVVVAQTIDKLHVKSPVDRKTLDDMVKAGFERLWSYQHEDGGWGWWQDDESRVFMTAYVVSGLGEASAAGYKVDEQRFANGRNWLIRSLATYPNMLPELRAYVVYALVTTGEAPKVALDKLWSVRERLSDEGLALTGLALDSARDPRAMDATKLLETKAHVTNSDAYWPGNYDGLLDYWDDTSAETTAMALKLLVRQDRSSSLLAKTAVYLGKHRDGDYWYSTKQTAMVIEGITDYLALSGELANSSDVEILVKGVSFAKRHFSPSDGYAPPWRVQVPANQAGSGGELTIRKSGNGITYWSAENTWYSAGRSAFQQGQLSLNIARNYYLLQKKQPTPSDPITYDLVPLHGPVHVGDIVAVRLAVSGGAWKYLMAEDPIPAGVEFLADASLYKLNNKPDWWADWFTRKEFRDDRAAFFNTEFSGRREYVYLLKVVNPGKFAISPAQAGPMYQPGIQSTTDPATLEVQP